MMNNLTAVKKLPVNKLLELTINSGSSIRIYPNPTASFMLVEAEGPELISLKVSEIDGKDLSAHISVNRVTDTKHIINISALEDGVYVLKTPSNTRVIYKKQRVV